MNSGSCKISISFWVCNLFICCGCILVLAWMSCFVKVLLERRVYVMYALVLWFA